MFTMTKRMLGLLAIMLCLGMTQGALAVDSLVEVSWVKANLHRPGVVIVDVQPQADYLRGHIPGAMNTDYFKSGWIEDRAADKVPDMFPQQLDRLAAHIGALGIDNDTHVVLVPQGKSIVDVGWATRIYWTFKALGHDRVSLLNGGMEAWSKDKANPVANGAETTTAMTFIPHPDLSILATIPDVRAAAAEGVMLLDGRPDDHYKGINRHGRATQSGTLPGAKSLPAVWTTVNGGGQIRSLPQLRKLYEVAGVPTGGKQITFCNTGHLSSVTWFISSELFGNRQARLYDGSMVEWTMLKAGPVEQKVVLP